MATNPDGSTIPLAYFYQLGTQHGEAAARMKRPRSAVDQDMAQLVPQFQDPRYKATAEDKGTYRTAWLKRYDYVISQLTPKEQDMAKTATAQEEQKLTVDQWEQQNTIPDWSIAKAVASNFNTAEKGFESRVAAGAKAMSSSAEGKALAANCASFIAQWNAIYIAIQAQAPTYTPSSAVAEVRKARSTMALLDTALAKTVTDASLQKDVVVQVDKNDIKPPPPPPPVIKPTAKAKIPGWGIVAGLAAAVAGIFYAFRKKKDEPKKLPGRS